MKRAVLLAFFIAAAGAAAYWIQGRHGGDVHSAWADAAQRLGIETAAATGGSEPGSQGGPRAGQSADRRGGPGGRGEAPRVAVVSAVAQTQDLPITLSSLGWIEPIATVTLRARVEGEILEQNATDGQMVEKGEVLFRLDDRETQAQIARDQAALARDLANQSKAEADLKRTQDLLAKNIASQVQAEQYAADAKVAAANVAADRAALEADKIKLGYATVTAPISGRLGIVRVTKGNLVRGNDNVGEGLVTITQMKPLRASFSLPERDLDVLRAALAGKEPAPVRVYASGSEQVLATGSLTFLDSSVDTASGTITAKATFPNEDGRLWPGQYVRVEVDVGTRSNATTVPLVAVQPGQDAPFAYVVTGNNTVERRKVEVAARFGDVAAIASGIRPGEHVVVEGQMRLRDGSRVTETIAQAPAPNRTAQADETGTVR
jgi:multidrug efflux system membrane fusion protein